MCVEAHNNSVLEWRKGIMTEHVGDSDSVPAPAVVGKDKENTTSIPPNQTPPPSFNDGSGPSGVNQTDARPDSQAHQRLSHSLARTTSVKIRE